MQKDLDSIRHKLAGKGLKVTPQRLYVLQAIYTLDNHPTADQIIEYIRPIFPAIATGTVYKVLDTLVENQLLSRVKTDKDYMRYDGVVDSHHHMYCKYCDMIDDYENSKLDELLNDFFKQNKIKDFEIEDIRLQLLGRFTECKE